MTAHEQTAKHLEVLAGALSTPGEGARDLQARAREAFYATYNAALPDNTSPEDHDAATDTALAAVIAVVQEDRTREIAHFVRLGQYVSSVQRTGRVWANVADAIIREFGGPTR